MPHQAYIALGSNQGDRCAHLQRAADLLQTVVKVVALSSFREYPAIDSPPGSPAFLNAAAHVQTDLSPEKLLATLLEVEQQMGRVRSIKNAPRVIDLDLLLYDHLELSQPDLELPHPRMHLRRFVMEPLAEIAPNLPHPMLHKSVRQLFSELP